jgi:cytochrome P450
MSLQERALHLQGVFFHTGCVQMSEALTHLTIAAAQHPSCWERLAASSDDDYLDLVITESLRAWPLFGVAHRITDREIQLPSCNVAIAEGYDHT